MTGSPGGRPGDTFDFNARARARTGAAATPSPRATGRGRRLGTTGPGTVALAVSAMVFYWMLPAITRNRHGPRPKG